MTRCCCYSRETGPRCSSPVDPGRRESDKQTTQNHDKSGDGPGVCVFEGSGPTGLDWSGLVQPLNNGLCN